MRQRKTNKKLHPGKLFSLTLSMLLFAVMMPMSAFAEVAPEELDVSRSKSATQLDENYTTDVTLSLPSAEESLVSDVVFVMDYSSCQKLAELGFYNALDKLAEQVGSTSAKVHVGAVVFRGVAETYPLEELTPAYISELKSKIKSPEAKGSNMHAGILAAKEMLEESSTPDARKYIVLISDGITYSWDNEGTQYAAALQYHESGEVMYASNSDYEIYHGGLNWYPEGNDWKTYIESISDKINKTLAEKSEPYTRDKSAITKYIAKNETDKYACSVDVALSKCLASWDSLHLYNRYVMTMKSGQYGEYFMNALDGAHSLSFDQIQNDIFYLLDKGSFVTDTIGDKFELTDLESFALTVGDEKLPAIVDGNKVYFGGNSSGNCRFMIEYNADTKSFIWTINEAVSNFAPVQLTYKLKLTNPATAVGTYGQKDLDGDTVIDDTDQPVTPASALYTNESAILTPVDTDGTQYAPIAFPKPSVSYTISKDVPGGDDPAPAPKPDSPKTGDSSILILWSALLLISVAGASTCFIARKRRNTSK